MIKVLQAGRWWAVGVLGLALAVLSATAQEYRPAIVEALNRQDTTQVLSLIDAELKVDPNYASYYLLRGKIFYARRQSDAALEQFDSALRKKPKLLEAMYYQGLIYLEKENPDEAKKAFSNGLKKAKEEKALFHNGMGLYYLKVEEYAKADVEFRKAIQVGPDQAEFHANLGDANYFSEIYPLAISEYNKVIEMDTTNLDIYFRLARAYVAQGQYNDALGQLSVVLVRDSSYAPAWKEAGKLYTMAGLSANTRELKEQRFKEAIGSYNKYLALSQDSTDGEVFFNLGRSYSNLGGYAPADSAFEYVLSLGDVPKGIYLYLGRGYIGEERYQDGIEVMKKHLDYMKGQDPEWQPGAEEADLYRRMGDGYKAMDDYPNAAESYVKALELEPNSSRAAAEAALAFHQLKNFPEALKYYQKRIELGPDSWNMYLNAAFCTLNMQDWQLSVDYLKKVVELDSSNVKAMSLLSNTYLYHLDDCTEGSLWTKKWMALDSTDCDALQNMGYANFRSTSTCTADYARALTYFTRALDCNRAKGKEDCGNSDLMLSIAQANHLHAVALADKNQKDESKKYFKSAFDWYKKVLKCDPGNEAAKQGVRDTEFEF